MQEVEMEKEANARVVFLMQGQKGMKLYFIIWIPACEQNGYNPTTEQRDMNQNMQAYNMLRLVT